MQVFSFPVASPPAAMTRDDMDAISHLELCLDYQRHWCEHKTSVTISVKEDEWAPVGDWVYAHFDELAGTPTPHRTCMPSRTCMPHRSPGSCAHTSGVYYNAGTLQ